MGMIGDGDGGGADDGDGDEGMGGGKNPDVADIISTLRATPEMSRHPRAAARWKGKDMKAVTGFVAFGFCAGLSSHPWMHSVAF